MPIYKSQKPVPYEKEEGQYRTMILNKIEQARQERDQNHDNFDGMTYLEYYESNAKAARSYIPPKKNEEDTRIVTGITEEKVNTMLSSILSFNFEPNIEAFDVEDELVSELGENMEAMVRKSREIENYDSTRRLIYKEALDQGDAFVEEVWEHPIAFKKRITEDAFNSNKFLNYKWSEEFEVLRGEAKVNMIDGRNFFFGNMNTFEIDEQPFIVTREVLPREIVKSLYGDWDRWDYVPEGLTETVTTTKSTDVYSDYSMYKISQDYVEIIKYQDKTQNEFQIFLNGVMMLPIKFPLSYVNGVDEQGLPNFSVSRLSINPIAHNFPYSKSTPAKTKVKQSVKDNMLKWMLLKTESSFKPALANNSGEELSQHVLRPGMITDDVDADMIKPIVAQNGVTQSEFNMYTVMGQEIDEISTSKQFGGTAEGGSMTATEVDALTTQNAKKLGSALWGITLFEKRISKLRIGTILRNWTTPLDTRIDGVKNDYEKVYRKINIDIDNKKGDNIRKIISFSEDLPDKYKLYGEAKEMEKKLGKKVSITVLDPFMLRMANYIWKMIIVPTQKDTSMLERELFFNDVVVNQKIFEPQGIKLNYEYLKKKSARIMKEDPDKFFATSDFKDLMMTQVPGEAGESDNVGSSVSSDKKTDELEDIAKNPLGKQVSENINPQGKRAPSVSRLANS
jgi:hypothetical protein